MKIDLFSALIFIIMYHFWFGNWSCLLTRTLETALSKDRLAHRFKRPSFFKIHLKNLQKNRAAPRRPIALQHPSQWPNHQILRARTLKKSQGTVQCSLSQCALELASVKCIIWTCVPQKVRWELLYTWSLSLSWQLQTWTRGSYPVVHVPSSGASLTWALLLTLFLAKLLMHGTAQCIANLRVRSLLERAS